jgi:hypothetical protein
MFYYKIGNRNINGAGAGATKDYDRFGEFLPVNTV